MIGNSITLHETNATKKWYHDGGMAASDQAHDYAHLLATALGVPAQEAYIRNFYPFETSASGAKINIASIRSLAAERPDIVVLEFGDNVKFYKPYQLLTFSENLNALVAQFRGSAIYCLSTFWHSRIVDYVIERACERGGGTPVFIGDIYASPNNPDQRTRTFAEDGVERHPKNYAMAMIADRILKSGAHLRSTTLR